MGSVQAEDDVLGYTKIGGTEVPIIAPKYEGEPYVGPFKIGSEPYVQIADGLCDRLARLDVGRWLKGRLPEAQANLAKGEAPEWRIKVIVFKRADHASLNTEAAWRMYLEAQELAFIKQQLALTEATVEAENRGTVDLVWEYSEAGIAPQADLERSPELHARTAASEDSSGTVTPAIHGILKIQADGQSILEPTDLAAIAPCPSQSVSLGALRTDEAQAHRLYPGYPRWMAEVEQLVIGRAQWLGYRGLVGVRCKPEFWKDFCSTKPFTSQQFLTRASTNAVLPDNLVSNPNLALGPIQATEEQSLRLRASDQLPDFVEALIKDTKISLRGLQISSPSQNREQLIRRLAGQLEPNARENFGRRDLDEAFGTRQELGPELLQLFSDGPAYMSKIADGRFAMLVHPTEEVEVYSNGWKRATKGGWSNWTAEGEQAPTAIRSRSSSSSPWIVRNLVPAATSIELIVGEAAEYKSALLDTEKGPGIKVDLKVSRPMDRIPLARPIVADLVGKHVEFWYKTNSAVPYQVARRWINFKPSLTGLPRILAQRLESDPQSGWAKVSVPASSFLELALDSGDRTMEGFDVGSRQITLAGFKIADGDAAEDLGPDQPFVTASLAEATKALTEATGSNLRSALKRVRTLLIPMPIPGKTVQPAVPDAALIQGLTVASRSGDYWCSLAALQLLVKLGVPEAEAALKYGIVFGPFDHNRFAAIQVLPQEAASKVVAELSSSVTSQEVRVRLAACARLAEAKTEDANIALLVMLRDPEVSVRYVAAKSVNAASPLGARRLLYAAVNDPYESVRAAAYTSLIRESTAEETLKEAYKGIKDDAFTVRMAVLKAMAAKPNANQRQAIGIALSDPWPPVRAEAVIALMKQPGEVTEKEVEHLVLDPFPLIRQAMQELAKAKGLSFAWD